MGKQQSGCFSNHGIQMVNRYMNKHLASLVLRELQIKTTLGFYLPLSRMVMTKNKMLMRLCSFSIPPLSSSPSPICLTPSPSVGGEVCARARMCLYNDETVIRASSMEIDTKHQQNQNMTETL